MLLIVIVVEISLSLSLPPCHRCVHCHNLIPAFQEVARRLKPFNITVARVNIEKEKKTQAKFEILTLPAVRIFRRGIVYDYDGPTQEKGTEG